ncbi:MAG TPA: LysR family transcriptional regulator ArgP [Pseudoduganella sp.]
MPHLNAAQLAAFAAIVRQGSFEAAARHLHVTSSAISQRLKLLEDTLGQVLVVRATPCRATAAGQTLLRHVCQVQLLEDELFREIGMAGDCAAAPVRLPVAVNADSLHGWFLDAFNETCARENVTLDVRVEDQEHSATLLRHGEVMAAVSASAAPTQGCSVTFLGNMRYFAVATNAFRDRYFSSGVDAHALSQAPVLVYNGKDRMQQAFIEMLTPQGIEPPSHFIPSITGFIHIAEQGLGWGMIPEYLAEPSLQAGRLVQIVPGTYLDIALYWHRWRIDSPALDALSRAILRAAQHALKP